MADEICRTQSGACDVLMVSREYHRETTEIVLSRVN